MPATSMSPHTDNVLVQSRAKERWLANALDLLAAIRCRFNPNRPHHEQAGAISMTRVHAQIGVSRR